MLINAFGQLTRRLDDASRSGLVLTSEAALAPDPSPQPEMVSFADIRPDRCRLSGVGETVLRLDRRAGCLCRAGRPFAAMTAATGERLDLTVELAQQILEAEAERHAGLPPAANSR
jgi:hypothetical protein